MVQSLEAVAYVRHAVCCRCSCGTQPESHLTPAIAHGQAGSTLALPIDTALPRLVTTLTTLAAVVLVGHHRLHGT
jgi:hypothetical protein